MISKNFNILLVASVLFIVFIQTSLAIRCWDCESNTDENCGDPFNNRTITARDCRDKCRKIVERVNGYTKFSRGCHEEQVILQDADIDICYTDGCNAASSHVPYALMILAIPLLIVTKMVLNSKQS